MPATHQARRGPAASPSTERRLARVPSPPDDPGLTPETCLGADREQFYGGGSAYVTGRFAPPATLPPDSFGLAGDWSIGQQSITAGRDAGIALAARPGGLFAGDGVDVGGPKTRMTLLVPFTETVSVPVPPTSR
jgi:Thioredoxin like C-terminal domain